MIKLVLFDLGSTLIYTKTSWKAADFWRTGDAALVRVLQEAGLPLTLDQFYEEYQTFLDQYYAHLPIDEPKELTAFASLSELLSKKGYTDLPPELLRSALEAMYAVTNKNWEREADAIPTLTQLKAEGYQLGLVSNTSDDAHVQKLIDEHGFRPFFEYVITSAGLGIRKPDRRIFQAALDYFHAAPEATAMVGDTLEADILGANQMGIFSIWITRRALGSNPDIIPKAKVATLEEIPAVLKTIP